MTHRAMRPRSSCWFLVVTTLSGGSKSVWLLALRKIRFGVGIRRGVGCRLGVEEVDVARCKSLSRAPNGATERDKLFLKEGRVVEDCALFEFVVVFGRYAVDDFADEAREVDIGNIGLDLVDGDVVGEVNSIVEELLRGIVVVVVRIIVGLGVKVVSLDFMNFCSHVVILASWFVERFAFAGERRLGRILSIILRARVGAVVREAGELSLRSAEIWSFEGAVGQLEVSV